MAWELKFQISGQNNWKLSGWTAQIILKVAGILTVKVEQVLSLNILEKAQLLCTGKEVICGAVILATSTFGYDDSMGRYLRSTNRADVADAADKVLPYLTGDAEVYANPEL
jgi:aconitate hydratase